jgi:hypothetical protein
MSTLLLSLQLHRGRDVLQARQRTRQIAGLLGFEGLEQTAISALVLSVSLEALAQHQSVRLQLALDSTQLEIRCQAEEASKLPFRKLRTGSRALIGPLSQFYPGMQAEVDPEGGFRTLTFPLPEKPARVEAADLPWMVEELDRNTPLDPLEELGHWNQEMLQLTRLARAYRFFGETAEQAA